MTSRSTCGCTRHSLHCIVPPYLLEHLAQTAKPTMRKQAIATLAGTAEATGVRRTLCAMPSMTAVASPDRGKQRLIYDATGLSQAQLPGKLVRSEGDKKSAGKSKDPAVDEAFKYSGTTWDFYDQKFSRNSLDDKGMALISSVHFGQDFNNAFWNGEQMVYGDGDGQIFLRFTKSLDVVGHELTHGVVAHECNLDYQGEPGALNEHMADVFGITIRQWKLKTPVDKAEWRIGTEIMGPGVKARALRDFGPDKAYVNDALLGTDPQPKNLKNQYKGSDDNGGVHINSGIPNHAYYVFARSLGGNAWDAPIAIWYETMRKLSSNSSFADMVSTTEMVAIKNHGSGSVQHKALMAAWKEVGF
ncbi:M4 family metallopeptidase [soil metagenome]